MVGGGGGMRGAGVVYRVEGTADGLEVWLHRLHNKLHFKVTEDIEAYEATLPQRPLLSKHVPQARELLGVGREGNRKSKLDLEANHCHSLKTSH